MSLVEELLRRVNETMTPEEIADLKAKAAAEYKAKKFLPSPGPQTDAYNSEADIMLYGGAAGGGKSALLVGLAYTQHTRSLICRRQYTDMGELIRFALDEVHGSRDGYRGDPPMRLQTKDGRQIEFFAAAQPGDEQHRQGQPVDFIGIDEAAQFLEEQVVFLMGWLRSSDLQQRCRVVLASNPPLSAEGRWLNEWFAPWIEPDHPNKAKPGELRWYVRGEGDKWKECPGPEPVQVGFKADGSPRMVTPMSRTFIPSKLDDNPYYAGTGYERQLANMPEMYRVALLEGNFTAAREDHEKQVIPTQWILEAQKRWTPNPPANSPMCSIGVDVAQGGADSTVLAPRYDYWFDKPTLVPGKETPLGADVAALIFKHIRHNAIVVVDAEGGYGLGAYEHMKGNNIPVVGYKGGGKSTARTKDRLLNFYNKRAETWWKFREALDPDQPGGSRIALPPDSGLRDDLACVRMAPNYDATTRGIKIESKDDIRKRLGRSPDRGDAVVMALTAGPTSATHHQIWRDAIRVAVKRPRVIQGYESRRRRHF